MACLTQIHLGRPEAFEELSNDTLLSLRAFCNHRATSGPIEDRTDYFILHCQLTDEAERRDVEAILKRVVDGVCQRVPEGYSLKEIRPDGTRVWSKQPQKANVGWPDWNIVIEKQHRAP